MNSEHLSKAMQLVSGNKDSSPDLSDSEAEFAWFRGHWPVEVFLGLHSILK